MIVAFADATGRLDASQAARLYAHAMRAAGVDVVLVRAVSDTGPTDPYTADLDVVTLPADARSVAAALAGADPANDGERVVVADLPFELIVEPRIRSVVDVPVLAVGPYARDEREALARIVRLRVDRGGNPREPASMPVDDLPWLLGCRRGGGGPAASAFAGTMANASADSGAVRLRVLPVAMGPLSRSEDMALEAGRPTRRNLRDGTVLALALRDALLRPPGTQGVHPGREAETDLERIALTSDERSLPERLHDLADAIDAILQGGGPSAADLADAPILDHWIRDVVPTTVLKGFVTNHPGIADGRPVRTTEVFVTDNATYARTLSRLYALRMPGPPGEPSRLQ